MPLSRTAIKELQAIYLKEYGRDLPEQETWAMGYRLLAVFDVLTRPSGSSSPFATQGEDSVVMSLS